MSEPAIEQLASFFVGRVDSQDFQPFEYQEADGSTQRYGEAAVFRLQGSGGRGLAVGLFRATQSGKSPVYTSQAGDETFLVLSGSVTIEVLESGETFSFREGDVASWSKGTPTVWDFSTDFVKFFVVAEP